jgi:hypothetical protein
MMRKKVQRKENFSFNMYINPGNYLKRAVAKVMARRRCNREIFLSLKFEGKLLLYSRIIAIHLTRRVAQIPIGVTSNDS